MSGEMDSVYRLRSPILLAVEGFFLDVVRWFCICLWLSWRIEGFALFYCLRRVVNFFPSKAMSGLMISVAIGMDHYMC